MHELLIIFFLNNWVTATFNLRFVLYARELLPNQSLQSVKAIYIFKIYYTYQPLLSFLRLHIFLLEGSCVQNLD